MNQSVTLTNPLNAGATFDQAVAAENSALQVSVFDQFIDKSVPVPEDPTDAFIAASMESQDTLDPAANPFGIVFDTMNAAQQGFLAGFSYDPNLPEDAQDSDRFAHAARIFKESYQDPQMHDKPYDLALKLVGSEHPNLTAALATGFQMFADPIEVALAGFPLLRLGGRAYDAFKLGSKAPIAEARIGLHEGVKNQEVRQQLDFLVDRIDKGDQPSLRQYEAILKNNPDIQLGISAADRKATKKYLSTFGFYNSKLINSQRIFQDVVTLKRKAGDYHQLAEEMTKAPMGRAGVFATKYLEINQPRDVDNIVATYMKESERYVASSMENLVGLGKEEPMQMIGTSLKMQPGKLSMDIGEVVKMSISETDALGYRLLLADIADGMRKSFNPNNYSFSDHATRVRFFKLFGLREQLISNLTLTPRKYSTGLYKLNTAGPEYVQHLKLKRAATTTAPAMSSRDQARLLGRSKLDETEIGEALSKLDTTDDLNVFLNKATMPDNQWQVLKTTLGEGVEKAEYAYQSALMSNPKSHLVNNAMNFFTVVVDPVVSDMAGASVALLRGDLGAALGQFKGMMAYQKAVWQSMPNVLRVFVKGPENLPSSVNAWANMHEASQSSRAILTPAARSQASGLQQGWETVVPFLPLESLGKQDSAWRMVGYKAEIERLATIRAWDEAPDPALMADFRVKFANDPNFEMSEQAFLDTERRVFQNPLGNIAGPMVDILNRIPASKMIFPFRSTPLNVMKYSFGTYSPFQVFGKRYWADIAAGGARRDSAVGRLALSSALLGWGATNIDLTRFTGSTPQGEVPRYHVNLGDNWRSYERVDSVRTVIGTITNLSQLMAYTDWDSLDGAERATELIYGGIRVFAEPLLDNNWLFEAGGSVVALDDMVNRGEEWRFESYLNKWLGGAATPGMARFLSPDPHVREYTTALERTMANWGIDDNLPWKQDLFGNMLTKPVQSINPFSLHMGTNQDDLYTMMGQVGYKPADVARDIRGVDLTAMQRARIRTLRAAPEGLPTLEEAIRDGIRNDTYTDGNREEKKQYIANIVNAFHQVAIKQLLAENRPLREMVLVQGM